MNIFKVRNYITKGFGYIITTPFIIVELLSKPIIFIGLLIVLVMICSITPIVKLLSTSKREVFSKYYEFLWNYSTSLDCWSNHFIRRHFTWED
jgi:hypothetical protein